MVTGLFWNVFIIVDVVCLLVLRCRCLIRSPWGFVKKWIRAVVPLVQYVPIVSSSPSNLQCISVSSHNTGCHWIANSLINEIQVVHAMQGEVNQSWCGEIELSLNYLEKHTQIKWLSSTQTDKAYTYHFYFLSVKQKLNNYEITRYYLL